MLDMWKTAGPHIDVIAPDIHVPGIQGYKSVMQQFTRPDNPLFIPETDGYGSTRGNDGTARFEFMALGAGSFGFSPFGIDRVTLGTDGKLDVERQGLAENNRLIVPSEEVLAQLQFEGKLQTAVEEPGLAQIELTFGDWTALVSFPPAYDPAVPTDSGLSLRAPADGSRSDRADRPRRVSRHRRRQLCQVPPHGPRADCANAVPAYPGGSL